MYRDQSGGLGVWGIYKWTLGLKENLEETKKKVSKFSINSGRNQTL